MESTGKRTRILCPCGASITANTWLTHLVNSHCSLSATNPEEFKRIVTVLRLRSEHPYAWKVSDGIDATREERWFISVINGDTKTEDWVFVSPRPLGMCPPKQYTKLSENRKGVNNPACIYNKPRHDTEDICRRAKELWDSGILVGDVHKTLSKEFHNFSYLFADIQVRGAGRGNNKRNTVIAHLLGMSVHFVAKEACRRRGKTISAGQLSSEKFRMIASRIGASLFSSRRITKPQLKLFDIVKKYDQEAILEYKIFNGRMYRSVDIYSPKINAFIEMHGRVFHDFEKTNLALLKYVHKNAKSEELKRKYASERGIMFYVFWDDEQETWENCVMEIYEKIKN